MARFKLDITLETEASKDEVVEYVYHTAQSGTTVDIQSLKVEQVYAFGHTWDELQLEPGTERPTPSTFAENLRFLVTEVRDVEARERIWEATRDLMLKFPEQAEACFHTALIWECG